MYVRQTLPHIVKFSKKTQVKQQIFLRKNNIFIVLENFYLNIFEKRFSLKLWKRIFFEETNTWINLLIYSRLNIGINQIVYKNDPVRGKY